MLQPQHPSPPRGRMENCRSSLSLRGSKLKRRMPEQQLTATMAPGTEPEKGDLVNRLMTSSLPQSSCVLAPAFLYTLSLSIIPLPHLAIISSTVPKKWMDVEMSVGHEGMCKTTREYIWKNQYQMENGILGLLITVKSKCLETLVTRK